MRVVQNQQMTLGEVDLSNIEFDLQSRDDIPKILRGLQAIYVNQPLREQIFDLLEKELLPKVNKSTGRPGMALWNILVCAVVRLDLNIDYDRLHNLVNEHQTLRLVLGHSEYNNHRYAYQTLVDNVTLFTPELLGKISVLVVKEGHAQLGRVEGTPIAGRCDSFVVETDVDFPTDITLLLNAIRKILVLSGQWCEAANVPGCRQYRYNVNCFKRLVYIAQNKRHCSIKAKNKSVQTEDKPQAETAAEKQKREKAEAKQKEAEEAVKEAHQVLLDAGAQHVLNAKATLLKLVTTQPNEAKQVEIEGYIADAERQLDQIERRVIKGQTIPHEEKVFSIFEPHTEWICKGKAGVPQELGIRVCIMEDQDGFILHHHVMSKQTDDAVAVTMVKETQKKFADLKICSFDKGFHSKPNQAELGECLDKVIMPRKGKLSKEAKEIEQEESFVHYRHAHAAVESAINALEVHGLDYCPDHGLDGFERYVALAMLARNIHRLGDVMWQRDVKKAQKLERAERRRQEKRLA